MKLEEIQLEEELKRYFGYNAFRPHQKEIVEALLNRQDVLAILPTGAGKSLCYQLPALVSPGLAVVVSPLISLMQDQVVSLFKNGIQAAFINSSLPASEIREVLDHLADYKLIYVAPERLVDPDFIAHLKKVELSFFVIDEAHCISQWGHSFRVEYRQLALIKKEFASCPVIALTATATPDVEKDIQTQLAMNAPCVVKGSFDRPNLTIRAHSKFKPEEQLEKFLKEHEGQSGIIYSATRKGVDATYQELKKRGFSVGRYHAGMPEQERSLAQNSFLHDQTAIMVATVAFGMGIHKPDIRYVVHLDMPKTIEQYYQEIGRAGRDGLPADCLMLYGAQDLIVYSKVPCGGCDICLEEYEAVDATITAQKILSCVFRLNQNVGIRMLTDVLRGSKATALLTRGYDKLSTYGLLKEMSEAEVRYSIDSLIHLGLLQVTEGDYPVVKWTERSQTAVKGQEPVFIRKKHFKPEKEPARQRASATINFDAKVFEALRQLRTEIAKDEKVPPYVVFSDRALQEMAAYLPRTQDEFGRINGVGPIKWLKYGEQFLACIDQLR